MGAPGWRGALVAGVAAALTLGCAAGARWERGSWIVRDKRFQVTPPEGWARVPVEGADLAFREPARAAGLLAHGTCEAKVSARPLPVLARHLRFGLREVGEREEEAIELLGHPGRRSRFTAWLDGVPVAVDAVTLAARGCVYDLAVVTPPGAMAGVAADFARFIGSFRLLESAR